MLPIELHFKFRGGGEIHGGKYLSRYCAVQ